MRVSRRVGLCFVAVLALSSAAGTAHADEPVAAREPTLMTETAEVTSVVDAFDKDDPFDLNIVLGFTQSWKTAKIRRESQLPQNGLEGPSSSQAGFIPATENIASYSSSMSVLNLGVDVGLYHDLALVIRMPVILAWSQSLGDLNGSAAVASQILADPAGGQLFSVPSSSPTRSGIDTLNFGLDWAIFNQQRDQTKPTWVIGIDGRFGVGTPLHACNANAPSSQPECLNPMDPTSPTSRSPGISRAMDGIEARTVVSKRYGYVEPYTGFSMLAEFPQSNSDFGQTNGLTGALLNHPPLLGTFMAGIEVIPWERREQFQRLVADFRMAATYHSAGREYTELFDALGSSQANSLRSPNPTGYTNVGCPNGALSCAQYGSSYTPTFSGGVPFTGITDQQAFGSVAFNGSATWQAGEYVKFVAGLGLTFAQNHLITAADACNPNLGSAGFAAAGPCKSNTANGTQEATGIPNPNHRDTIDLPGDRFSADNTVIWDLSLSGVVMF
jgi:hypothetical protein